MKKKLNLNFDICKGFLFFTEFGSKIRQIYLICQLILNFGKTQIVPAGNVPGAMSSACSKRQTMANTCILALFIVNFCNIFKHFRMNLAGE